jgi:hypothetical protein
MKWFTAAIALALLTVGFNSPTKAQLAPANENGLTMGHVHLKAKDAEGMRRFFATLGGTPASVRPEMIVFPNAVILVAPEPAPTGGSVGSTVNNFGFSVKNIKQARAQWAAAGVQWEPKAGRTRGFVIAPEGVRVEVVEDRNLATPIAFRHIHFFTPASPRDARDWYVKTFGAIAKKQDGLVAASLPGVSLLFSKTKQAVSGTSGRSLDHIGFEIKDLEPYTKTFESRGIKFDRPYQKMPKPVTTTAIAFVSDPWGTSVELTQDIEGKK